MWPGYTISAPIPRGNNCAPCCAVEPTLRVRPKLVVAEIVPYVQFECRRCPQRGGLAITEDEARRLWDEIG